MKRVSLILLVLLLANTTVHSQIFTQNGIIQGSTGYATGEVGIGTSSPSSLLNVQNGCVLFDGNIGVVPFGLSGHRMIWAPNKAAFRAGDATSTEWDDINIGMYSAALGYNTVASAYNTFAANAGTEATAQNASAFGNGSEASGMSSFATGYLTQAQGQYSFSSGLNTVASGDVSAAFNNGAQATSYGAFAANAATASGDNSFAVGQATASSSKAFAAGSQHVEAGGLYSFALGWSAKAMGDYSFAALGGQTSGANSVAIGENCSDGGYSGSITFSDWQASSPALTNQADNEFRARASGGFVFHSDPFMADLNTLTFNNGNLGIGVTGAATEKVDIEGRLRVRDIPVNTTSSTKVLVSDGGVVNYRDITTLGSYAWSLAPSGIPTSINSNIYRNGRVGIGTNGPNAQIHLANASCGIANLRLSANGSCGTAGDLLVGEDQSGTPKFVVKPTGSVGIGGTLNPLMLLDLYRGDFILTGGSNTFRMHYQYWLPNGEMFLSPADINGNMIATGIVMGINGHVGIGTNSDPTHRLSVNGSVIATGGYFTSDKRFKKDITHVDDALELISSLEGVRYSYKDNLEVPNLTLEGKPVMREFPEGVQIGLIAQDVEKVLPEVVTTDGEGYKGVAYQNIVPLLIEGIKEQQAQLEEKDNRIAELERRIGKIEALLNNNKTDISDATDDGTSSKAVLFQNAPNPFNGYTRINYRLPGNYSDAQIMVFDLNGRKLKSIPISGTTGEGSVNLDASELSVGMYLYSLVLDGSEVATKRMVIGE